VSRAWCWKEQPTCTDRQCLWWRPASHLRRTPRLRSDGCCRSGTEPGDVSEGLMRFLARPRPPLWLGRSTASMPRPQRLRAHPTTATGRPDRHPPLGVARVLGTHRPDLQRTRETNSSAPSIADPITRAPFERRGGSVPHHGWPSLRRRPSAERPPARQARGDAPPRLDRR
jgi:hypothetical protein